MSLLNIFSALVLTGLFFVPQTFGQRLLAGFNKEEYIEMVKITQKAHIDLDKWTTIQTVPDPEKFKFVYRSPVVGLDNIWDLWISPDSIAVISVRGSVPSTTSFLANIYAAMVPASGELQLEKDFSFKYNLSNHPNAAVHVGWLISMKYLSDDIYEKIDSCYRTLGIRDFIIIGHSQGGGISYLLTSHLESLMREAQITGNIQYKTYCDAGPKPCNLFDAYDFENLTRNGWAFNSVSTADWVPQVPFSIQTVDDFTKVNHFRNAKSIIKKQGFPKNMVLSYVYSKISKPAKRAQRNYQKYLGTMVSKAVKKQFTDFVTLEGTSKNPFISFVI